MYNQIAIGDNTQSNGNMLMYNQIAIGDNTQSNGNMLMYNQIAIGDNTQSNGNMLMYNQIAIGDNTQSNGNMLMCGDQFLLKFRTLNIEDFIKYIEFSHCFKCPDNTIIGDFFHVHIYAIRAAGHVHGLTQY